MDCNSCKERQISAAEPVPYISHEAEMARLERQHDKEREQLKDTIKKLWIALIICIAGLIGMFIYESQFETVTITAEQEADGDSDNYAVGGDYYGFPAESDD